MNVGSMIVSPFLAEMCFLNGEYFVTCEGIFQVNYSRAQKSFYAQKVLPPVIPCHPGQIGKMTAREINTKLRMRVLVEDDDE